MTLITLQTDFGTRDFFVAAMKAVIWRIAPGVSILDVTHDIPAYDLRTPGLNWLGLIAHCAPGTIHIGVIDPGVGTARDIVLVQLADQWLLAPDNGILTPVLAQYGLPTACYRVDNPRWMAANPHPTFHGRDIFAPVAAQLARGEEPAQVGPARDPATLVRCDWPRPSIEPGDIRGQILHIDHFGNGWTNIRREDLASAGITPTTARIGVAGQQILSIEASYGDRAGALVAVINAIGYVEVALAQGDAAATLNLTVDLPISIAG